MVVGMLLVRLLLPNSESLKDKRQVVKSLRARLTNQFGVSVAEVGEQDVRQIAEIGIALVSNEVSHVERVLDNVVKYVEETRPDLEITDCARDVQTFFQ
ncbi:MAG TPA: DUF503 domain-containing protein [Chloroflexota bacterium]|nr:DUF503 domain-containing protein [Chloroflexota bacterium]